MGYWSLGRSDRKTVWTQWFIVLCNVGLFVLSSSQDNATPEDCGPLPPLSGSSDLLADLGSEPVSARQLQMAQSYPYFEVLPSANVVTFDSHDFNCNRNFESPPIINPAQAGYPMDGTDILRNQEMACGIAQARFTFRTSGLSEYTDASLTALIQIRIQCRLARFIESDTCENVVDATGNFPQMEGCRFMTDTARLILSTRLRPNSTYTVTLKLMLPSGTNTAAENSFSLTTELFQVRVIEGTQSNIPLGQTIPNAKDEGAYTASDDGYDKRGYITSFTWQPSTGFYTPSPGAETRLTFGIRNFGVLGFSGKTYAIDFAAFPTDVWQLGVPAEQCQNYNPSFTGTVCDLINVDGSSTTVANGFRITIGSTPFINLGSGAQFELTIRNPLIPVNMHWMATSFRLTPENLPIEPFSVFLDKPINVLGKAYGRVAHWELASINQEQWVTLEFTPGNTVQPRRGQTSAILVIVPPDDFRIVDSASPQPDTVAYNALPCSTWPLEDQRAGRWVCTLEDNPIFRDTVYRVRLRVVNPPTPGAARSWRIELWQIGQTKPISITRGIRGMPISGVMSASVAPTNPLLGQDNVLRVEFTLSQNLALVTGNRLQVVAPAGFMIIKRCPGFKMIEGPTSTCRGHDSNGFDVIFMPADVIRANIQYIFEVQVTNPLANVPETENFWQFETVRPDRVAVDSTRYQGFFLFPFQFANADVVPVSRRVGLQSIIVRFVSGQRIEFDDYIRIRAPATLHWNTADLQFASSNQDTGAATLGTRAPTVLFDTPNVLVFQLTTAAEANIEYGVTARGTIPYQTPVPNRWWIEHYRQTGNPAPDNWRYIASSGAAGFRTQALVNARLEPFNIVAEGWQNPTLIVFETTVAVEPKTKNTARGIVSVPVEVYLQAPAGFTFICPVIETVYMPAYSVALPPNECVVDHNNLQARNQLHLYFQTGLQANTRYAFTIDIVNARVVDLALNTFYLATRVDGVMQEDVTLPGYRLASRMDNTRYLSFPREDRRVEAQANQVSFILGSIIDVEVPTILEVRAPPGFKFAFACTNQITTATWIPNMRTLPTVEFCQNREQESLDMVNIARIQMTGSWLAGSYGLAVTVSNPMFTPLRNYWGFTIYDRNLVPLMSESWTIGFEIKVVINPVFFVYNSGNSVDGEAAINRVELTFSVTTKIPPDPFTRHLLIVTAPTGFTFPNVCRDFFPDIGKAGVTSLPIGTGCAGNNGNRLTLTFGLMRTLENGTRYAFRFLVINPSQIFTAVNTERWWWRIETKRGDVDLEDLNRVVPSFPVYARPSYFQVTTLSKVGLAHTTARFHFRTTGNLPPQQTIHIYPPKGTTFNGLRNGACREEDPNILSRSFPAPLINGVTPLPEWVVCKVVGPQEVQLQNTEPILGGRPLLSGPVFEFFVKNVSNAESTADLNLFRITAFTDIAVGREDWTAEGWVIFPELLRSSVTSSNPGYGLFSNFTFVMQPVNEIPPFGSFQVKAPLDYYFGPEMETATYYYNPLEAVPPPQGALDVRPPATQTIICHALRVQPWTCPFAFDSCLERDRYAELVGIGMTLTAAQQADYTAQTTSCTTMQSVCDAGELSTLMTCDSMANVLTLTMQQNVRVLPRRIFQIRVQGYNRRTPPTVQENVWHFLTLSAGTLREVMDEKPSVPGFNLLGIVRVPTIVPADTKVSSIENKVRVQIVLSTRCEAPALLRIRYPRAFERNSNAAFIGEPVVTGPNFPGQVDVGISVGFIELEVREGALEAEVPLEITITLSNPDINPPKAENIWTFEAFSKATGEEVLMNCNYNVTGFKIYGEFSMARITGAVTAAGKQNILGVWFMLKSTLLRTDTSEFRIYLPPGYEPQPFCGEPNRGPKSPQEQVFLHRYDPERLPQKDPFPNTISFVELPSGITCVDKYDTSEKRHYVILNVHRDFRDLDDGRNYAFELGIINPPVDPPAGENFFRFETRRNGVIQHLRREVPSFALEKLREARVTPSFTTSLLQLNRMEFYIMSDKAIQGASKIRIIAPLTFTFTCDFFRTDQSLASTTTCYVAFTARHIGEFTMDSQDNKEPLTPLRLFVTLANPEFTPRVNTWAFELIDRLGSVFDSRYGVPGFDITGLVNAEIRPTFNYLGERNPLQVVFAQVTILNQADNGNELVLTAPVGYTFPENCTSNFGIRFTNQRQVFATSAAEELGGASYPNRFTFPPPGIKCTGFGNRTVILRLPDGHGLLKSNFTWTVDVDNPSVQPTASPGDPPVSNEWIFTTRVRPPKGGERIVDTNVAVPGFTLRELVPIRTDEGAAPSHQPLCRLLALLWVLLPIIAIG